VSAGEQPAGGSTVKALCALAREMLAAEAACRQAPSSANTSQLASARDRLDEAVKQFDVAAQDGPSQP
jgi:hypothetical protein